MVTGCWEHFEQAIYLTPPSTMASVANPQCLAEPYWEPQILAEKQEMDVASPHVPAQQPNSPLSGILESWLFYSHCHL